MKAVFIGRILCINCHLRYVIEESKGKEHEEEGLSIYLMNLRKLKDTGT